MCRIPFERALEFANKEKITDLLYPLFVHNIGGLLYHPTNQTRTNMVVQESQQRRLEGPQVARTPGSQPPALHHHHSLQTPVPSHLAQPPHSMASQPGRPALDRAHTFPTPPASASSLMGITNQGSSYEWGNQGMGQSSQPLSIDTTLNNARSSMPTTPATTPPGSNLQGMQFQGSHYDSTKPYYSTAPSSHGQYAPQPIGGYGHGQSLPSTAYLKNDMGPPSARGSGAPADGETGDATKSDRYSQSNGPAAGEGVPEQEPDYVQDNGTGYNSHHRGSYTYTTNPSVNTLTGEHSQLTPELSSPSQQNGGSGRMTPRTGGGPPSQWASGYNTPPRSAAAAASSLYNIVSDTRGTPANGTPSDSYSTPAYSGMNGTMPSGTKRMREDDEIIRPDSRGTEYDSKRRKTLDMSGPLAGPPMGMQPMKAGGVMPRRR